MPYITNSCGLSSKSAILAFERIHNYKNQRNQIQCFIFSKRMGSPAANSPNLSRYNYLFLLSNPKKTLLPKIEFFRSIGFSSFNQVFRTLSSISSLLGRSVEKHLMIHCLDFLKCKLLEDEKVVLVFKHTLRAIHMV